MLLLQIIAVRVGGFPVPIQILALPVLFLLGLLCKGLLLILERSERAKVAAKRNEQASRPPPRGSDL